MPGYRCTQRDAGRPRHSRRPRSPRARQYALRALSPRRATCRRRTRSSTASELGCGRSTAATPATGSCTSRPAPSGGHAGHECAGDLRHGHRHRGRQDRHRLRPGAGAPGRRRTGSGHEARGFRRFPDSRGATQRRCPGIDGSCGARVLEPLRRRQPILLRARYFAAYRRKRGRNRSRYHRDPSEIRQTRDRGGLGGRGRSGRVVRPHQRAPDDGRSRLGTLGAGACSWWDSSSAVSITLSSRVLAWNPTGCRSPAGLSAASIGT